MALADERCMLLTTFRKSGEPVATAVWLADLGDGEVGFWTSSESGKVKRLRHTAQVTVQPCSQGGKPKPGSEPVKTTARLVSGEELEALREKIVAKYGFWTKITKPLAKLAGRLRGRAVPYGDIGVAVKVPAGS